MNLRYINRKSRAAQGVLVSTAMLTLMLVPVALQDGWILFTRTLWLDEFHTLFVAEAESPAEVIRLLRQGADYNPPLLHLVAWFVGAITDGLSPVKLRLISFLSIWATMVGAFFLVRRTFGAFAAFTGALFLWAHPLVVQEAFNARFYAPWLLATVLFLLAINQRPTGRPVLLHHFFIAITAACLCTIHYFGILVWGLIIGSIFLINGISRKSASLLVPSLAGPITLVMCAPIYMGQRSTLSVSTWVPPVDWHLVKEFVSLLFLPPMLLGLLLLWAASRLLFGKPNLEEERADNGIRGMLATAGLPFVLVLFSVLIQPSTVARYGIVAVLSLVPLVSWALRQVPLPVRLLSLLIIGGATYLTAHAEIGWGQHFQTSYEDMSTALRSRASNRPFIVATRRHDYYPLASIDSKAAQLLRFAIVPDTVIRRVFPLNSDSAGRANMTVLERDVAGVHQKLFGRPRTIGWDAIVGDTLVVFIGEPRAIKAFQSRWLPNHTLRELGHGLFELRNAHPQAPAEPSR